MAGANVVSPQKGAGSLPRLHPPPPAEISAPGGPHRVTGPWVHEVDLPGFSCRSPGGHMSSLSLGFLFAAAERTVTPATRCGAQSVGRGCGVWAICVTTAIAFPRLEAPPLSPFPTF